MIALLLLTVLLIAGIAFIVYLLGFRLGGGQMQEELLRVRADAASSTRQMHELTRQAFTAMAEEAERRRRS